jgi:Tfp pilus assembly protein PilV
MRIQSNKVMRPGAGGAPFARSAFSLVEVVVSVFIIGLGLSGILSVYVQSAFRSDWSAQSFSAQMMAMSGLEQCRAAKFDPRGSPSTDQLVSSNFPPRVDILDIGGSSSIVTYGTNTTTISTISTNPLVKMVRVDCVWSYPRRGRFTNSVMTYRAPNQ